jgi:lipopolysaccharide biosynthesis glycosyltransferase
LKIAFAITSRNYLAQTKIAIESFILYNPEFEVFVFNIDNEKYETLTDC